MGKQEKEPTFRENVSEWLVYGGIVAGVIGLLTNPGLLLVSLGLVGSGVYLRSAK